MPVTHGARGASKQEAPSLSLAEDVLYEIPHLWGLLPPGTAIALAATSWSALLSFLRHGMYRPDDQPVPALEATTNLRGDPMSRLPTRPIFSISTVFDGALLPGLASRVDAGSEYHGRIEVAGAQVPVADAAALNAAARAANAAGTNDNGPDAQLATLRRVLDAATGELRLVKMSLPRRRDAPTFDNISNETLSDYCALLGSDALSRVEELHIRDLPVDAAQFDRVLGALRDPRGLRKLHVGVLEPQVMHGDVCPVADLVRRSPGLQHLTVRTPNRSSWLEVSSLTADITPDFVPLLLSSAQPSVLVTLNLSDTGLTVAGVRHLTAALSTSHVLTHLNVGRNNLGVEGAVALCPLIASSASLETLGLHNCSIGGDGAAAVCRAISGNAAGRIKHLDLGSNTVSGGARAMGEMLAESKSLVQLNLSNTCINDEAIGYLSNGLVQNNSLRVFLVDGTTHLEFANADGSGLSGAGILLLAQAVSRNKTLEVLSLEDINRFDSDAARAVQTLISGSTLRRLFVSDALLTRLHAWQVDAAGGSLLELGVAGNRTLEVLSIRNLQLRDVTARALAGGLRKNTTLKVLQLKWCTCSKDAWEQLEGALCANTVLEGLHLEMFRILIRGTDVADDNMEDGREFSSQDLLRMLQGNRTLRWVHLGFDDWEDEPVVFTDFSELRACVRERGGGFSFLVDRLPEDPDTAVSDDLAEAARLDGLRLVESRSELVSHTDLWYVKENAVFEPTW
ncbi:unnamed protein product [Pedinophyceae sp. YPF-701]|nr:unnamed protein product [Pedinophyceae sp. YPF-701]